MDKERKTKDVIIELRKHNNLSQQQLADKLGISKSLVAMWETDKRIPSPELYDALADYFNVDTDYLFGRTDIPRKIIYDENGIGYCIMNENGECSIEVQKDSLPIYHMLYDKYLNEDMNINEPYQKTKTINVLGRVAAGIPINAIEEIIDTEEITEDLSKNGEFFGLKIKGDSMEPRICNGDVVIVRQQNDAESGDIVIAMVNGDDATCKRLVKYASSIALVSLNTKYEPMMFTIEEIETKPVRIIGKVVELRGKL